MPYTRLPSPPPEGGISPSEGEEFAEACFRKRKHGARHQPPNVAYSAWGVSETEFAGLEAAVGAAPPAASSMTFRMIS